MHTQNSSSPTSCLILAGGTGKRLGGVDKGLIDLDGRLMIELLLESVDAITDDIVISANDNIDTYARFGRVVQDDLRYRDAGPLAGIASSLPVCVHDRVLVCCCDMPVIPGELIDQLVQAQCGHDLAVCSIADRVQLLMLMHKNQLASIRNALDQDQRSMMRWINSCDAQRVLWQADGSCLLNVNTEADLVLLKQALADG